MMAKAQGWHKPPPVIVLSGSDAFQCRRELRKALAACDATGRRVEYVDGSDEGSLADTLAGSILFDEPLLVVVSKPQKADIELIKGHLESKSKTICLVLNHEGKIRKDSKFAKALKAVPKKHHQTFSLPGQQHRIEDAAIKFVVQEAERYGKTIDTELAEALVSKMGTDYGVLSFEILKVATYLDALGEEASIKGSHLRGTMVRTRTANFAPLVDAVGKASVVRVVREMESLKANFGGDARGRTLTACAWLGNQAIRWLHAESLDGKGAESSEISDRMKMHPYVYKSFVLPVARRWGSARLKALVKRLSKVETAVVTGHIDPWSELECGLISLCRGVGGRG